MPLPKVAEARTSPLTTSLPRVVTGNRKCQGVTDSRDPGNQDRDLGQRVDGSLSLIHHRMATSLSRRNGQVQAVPAVRVPLVIRIATDSKR